jgi:SAM-dependent methyltransferase
MGIVLASLIGVVGALVCMNQLSYRLLGGRIRASRDRWDLNICCGRTDGGGINADIIRHADVPNFVLVDDIYSLPFRAQAFDHVLCSHTIEHVEDPQAFFDELSRVGRVVTVVLPPLWDLGAVLNLLEHRWVFLTVRKRHDHLPTFVRLPLARPVQRWLGQRIRA